MRTWGSGPWVAAVMAACDPETSETRRLDAAVVQDGGAGDAAPNANESAACPASPPDIGATCASGLRCDYEDPDMVCDDTGAIEAVCSEDDSTWELWQALSCAPLTAASPCEVVGLWQLQLEPDPQTLSGQPCGTPPATLGFEVRARESGVLQSRGLTGTISADGCDFAVALTEAFRSRSESGSTTTAVALTVNGSEASGTFERQSSGYCNGRIEGRVRAVRTAD
ncbi:MAG: hypothetical protein ABW321_27450 [Polyangiales bacterium]